MRRFSFVGAVWSVAVVKPFPFTQSCLEIDVSDVSAFVAEKLVEFLLVRSV